MPLGIIVLGLLVLIGGLFSIVWGFALITAGSASWLTGLVFSDSVQAWGGYAFGAGLWAMAIGVVEVITACGLWARKRWAWVLAVISVGLSMIGPLVGMYHGSGWSFLGLIIPAAIFFYLLFDTDVKRAFGRA